MASRPRSKHDEMITAVAFDLERFAVSMGCKHHIQSEEHLLVITEALERLKSTYRTARKIE